MPILLPDKKLYMWDGKREKVLETIQYDAFRDDQRILQL